MRAVRFHQFGPPSVLKYEDMPTPAVGPDDVVVQIKAAAINPSDVKNVQGLMPHTTLPRTPGRDFAGIVVQGPDDLLGQEVWGSGGDLGFERDGTHAAQIVLPRGAVRPKPAALTFEQAAAVGVPFVTAWAALVDAAQLTPGETVVVIGANGAVGSAAVQIAAWRGARVIGAIRDPALRDRILALGASHVVSTGGDFLQAVRDAADGRGADLIFDAAVGTPLFAPSLAALALRGRLVEITVSGGREVTFDLMDFYRRELRLLGVNTLSRDAVAGARILEALTPGFESGQLRAPAIAERWTLDQAVQAYERVASGAVRGKVILVPPETV